MAVSEVRMRVASSADSSDRSQMIMADSGSSEEVAVICNTDITSTESENNIINTVVLYYYSLKPKLCIFKKQSRVIRRGNAPSMAYVSRVRVTFSKGYFSTVCFFILKIICGFMENILTSL